MSRFDDVELIETASELIEGDVHRAGNHAGLALFDTADVEENLVLTQIVHLVPVGDADIVVDDVARRHGQEVHRILRGAVRRGIAELELGNIVDRHAALNRGGKYIDPTSSRFVADDLGTVDRPVLGTEDQFHVQELGTGVVAHVGQRVHVHGLEGDPGPPELPLVEARAQRS